MQSSTINRVSNRLIKNERTKKRKKREKSSPLYFSASKNWIDPFPRSMHGAINTSGGEMSQLNWTEILGWDAEQLDDLRYVAYSYIKQGVYDIALTVFDALAILSPPTAYDLQTIGALHLQVGNGLKALESLDRALRLDSTHL